MRCFNPQSSLFCPCLCLASCCSFEPTNGLGKDLSSPGRVQGSTRGQYLRFLRKRKRSPLGSLLLVSRGRGARRSQSLVLQRLRVLGQQSPDAPPAAPVAHSPVTKAQPAGAPSTACPRAGSPSHEGHQRWSAATEHVPEPWRSAPRRASLEGAVGRLCQPCAGGEARWAPRELLLWLGAPQNGAALARSICTSTPVSSGSRGFRVPGSPPGTCGHHPLLTSTLFT